MDKEQSLSTSGKARLIEMALASPLIYLRSSFNGCSYLLLEHNRLRRKWPSFKLVETRPNTQCSKEANNSETLCAEITAFAVSDIPELPAYRAPRTL